MTLPITRALWIWTGVGLGHLAALGFVWGSALHTGTKGEGILLVMLLSQDAEPALVSATPLPILTPTQSPPPAIEPLPIAQKGPAEFVAAQPSVALPAPQAANSVLPARFIRRVEPIYPRSARLAGQEGAVRLRLNLSAQGQLAAIEIRESSGSPALDAAALAAAQASAFAPAESEGRPVDSETEATYRFKLR